MKNLNSKIITLLISAGCLLASCGGGDDVTDPTPTPTPTPVTPTEPSQPTEPVQPENQTFDTPDWVNEVVTEQKKEEQTAQTSTAEPSSVIMYVSLPQELVSGIDDNDLFCVYVGDQIKMTLTQIAKDLDKNVWSAQVNNLKVGDQLTFKYYSAKTKYMYVTTSTVTVDKKEMNYGTFDDPKVLVMSAITK